ncbi:C-C motif chemokine 20-like [Antennarius striatus]|uniref:C-C motif chemokine 20-like n=1 Tax=Antennarius striatus TaxID=241820 RepID=UPI0035B47DF6
MTTNMTPRGLMTLTVLLFMLGLLCPAPAALGYHMRRACCTSYTRRPVPFHLIKGYREQTSREHCRIEAIIFYTMKKDVQICATRKDGWVRRILASLSSKLKKMSSSAAGETQKTETVTPFNHGGGVLVSSMETLPNTTDSFY